MKLLLPDELKAPAEMMLLGRSLGTNGNAAEFQLTPVSLGRVQTAGK